MSSSSVTSDMEEPLPARVKATSTRATRCKFPDLPVPVPGVAGVVGVIGVLSQDRGLRPSGPSGVNGLPGELDPRLNKRLVMADLLSWCCNTLGVRGAGELSSLAELCQLL